MAAQLDHPALVHIHDILELDEGLWIAMELVEGESLARILETGPPALAEALPLAVQIVSGLATIHGAGILHRDLKGENILVTPPDSKQGRSSRARILDFGLAKSHDDELSLTTTGGILGTPKSMSPEQAQGR